MIRRVKINEIGKIMAVTRACAQHLQDLEIYQWNEHYPSEAVFLNDMAREELHAYYQHGQMIGIIAATPVMDEEYRDVAWLTKSGNNLYIHRLAVHPAAQGKGFARKLMDFSEDMARRQKYRSIRLDTFSKNYRNQKFYEQRGYQRLGEVYFPMQSQHPFYCYELLL